MSVSESELCILKSLNFLRCTIFVSMSRLIIKNLPVYLTPDRLREHFQQKGSPTGTITDVKISLRQDGTSRRFGFVGFKSDQEATAARDWFDRTFIDSTRINVMVVEVCFFFFFHLIDVFNPTCRARKTLQLPDQISGDAWMKSRNRIPFYLLLTLRKHRKDRTITRLSRTLNGCDVV